ncbi:methionine aminopeptidase [Angustibacter aerolatus]
MRGSLGCLLMGAFYFNTSTGQVEELEKKSQSKDLLGPYPTREAAADALRSARERTESWDAEEREWREGDQPS